jgi:membrane fusion protein, multidrug efflux system
MQRPKLVPLVVVGVVLAGVVGGGAAWWSHKQRFETTDNAYVQAETVQVSSQLEGNVAEVLVEDNQKVEAGQLLVRLDPSDPQARLAQANANLAALQAAVRSVDDKASLEQAVILERAAGVASAEAAAERARLDLERYSALAKDGWVSAQRLQEQRSGASQTSAAVAQARAALEAERRSAASLGSARSQGEAQAAAAEAAVQKARVDLERTLIRAPVAGVIGARSVRPGQYVRPGAALMAIVPVGQSFVIANFKETQVARLRIGQPVEIRADAFGGQVIRGHIDSFAPATGAEFALIPVENAVGNFTKITQRLPVKIAVERGEKLAGGLRPGLSVKIAVDVRSDTGPSFAEGASGPQHLARQSAR